MVSGAALWLILIIAIFVPIGQSRQYHQHDRKIYDPFLDANDDLSLWIDEQQVKIFSGFSTRVYAIDNGRVSADLRNPNLNNNLPIIPTEVSSVNFTWKSGNKKYTYHFDQLQSSDETILKSPIVSIDVEGYVPQESKAFSVYLPCVANSSGIAMFSIGLVIKSIRGKSIPGTPLRLSLRKECAHRESDPECSKKCENNGWCNHEKKCQCPEGYMGQFCEKALCYPQCKNGGNCTAPAVCSCPKGYQGRYCEGGICEQRCLNGGKCIQKDKCQCTKGYLGRHCEISKCFIPCMNDGKCININKCRCPHGFGGDHCEIDNRQQSSVKCKRPCRNGTCMANRQCRCKKGWIGRFCNKRGNHRHFI